jgi:phytoene dehydrogenase-like protein
MAKSVIVIGSGFAGLSAASFMAKAGWQVTVLEKHEQAGGRARKLQANGFTFDMDQVGIGCQMFLNVILNSLTKMCTTIIVCFV